MGANFTVLEKLILIAVLFLAIIFALAGCTTNETRQVREIEKETYITEPLTVEIPMVGTAVVHPAKVTRFREKVRLEEAKKETEVPLVREVVSTVASSASAGPLGIAAGILGLITTSVGLYKAKKNGEQRDEVIDGTERSKAILSQIPAGKDPITGKELTAWDHLTASLYAEQSQGTVDAVKARVG